MSESTYGASTIDGALMDMLKASLDKAADFYQALEKIATLDDVGANKVLQRTGSYSAFDEPVSVRIAREAIAPDICPIGGAPGFCSAGYCKACLRRATEAVTAAQGEKHE